jgi:hypothetical protein
MDKKARIALGDASARTPMRGEISEKKYASVKAFREALRRAKSNKGSAGLTGSRRAQRYLKERWPAIWGSPILTAHALRTAGKFANDKNWVENWRVRVSRLVSVDRGSFLDDLELGH